FLAMLIGALEAANSVAEAFAGGSRGGPGLAIAAVVVAAVSALLLLAAGVALLARARGAATLARNAAVICLVVFAAIAAIRPMFSIAASILGIGFPVALLIVLYRSPRGGQSSFAQ